MIGWLLLVALTSLATLDALGIAVRSKPSGRAELGVIAFAAFCALLATPVLVLGYAERLRPRALAIVSATFLIAVFALVSRGAPRSTLRLCANAARDLVMLPLEALAETARARSMAFVALLACLLIVVASIVLTVFVPNATWDGFLYHEPMVGFAIQNHGFAMVPLPPSQAVQAANGYPRLCESLSLWFVIFTDKTLVELPNDLAAPAMILGAYVIARRFGDRITAMGLSCMLLLMPQAWAQLCQTYIDLLVAFFAIALIALATRSELRVRDVWLATLAALLLLGSKSSAIAAAPALVALAYLRILRRDIRRRPGAVIASVGSGVASIAAFGVLTPLRNWRAFQDPLWPVSYESAALGIHWKGLISLEELTSSSTLMRALDTAYDAPIGGLGDVAERGYGYALAWVLGPLALLGAAWAVTRACADFVRRRPLTDGAPLAWLLVATFVSLVTAPSLNGHNARYDLHIVACAMGICAWLFARPQLHRARPQVMAAAIALAVVPLFWMKGPGWYWVSTRHLEDVLRHPLESRIALERPEFDVIGKTRESELRAGDLVIFDQNVTFIGALWNFDYSSRVEYVPYETPTSFLQTIATKKPKWVVVGESDEARKLLERDRSWEYVGPVTPNTSAVFRREQAEPARLSMGPTL